MIISIFELIRAIAFNVSLLLDICNRRQTIHFAFRRFFRAVYLLFWYALVSDIFIAFSCPMTDSLVRGIKERREEKHRRTINKLIKTDDLARLPCHVATQNFRAARVTRSNGPRVPDIYTAFPFNIRRVSTRQLICSIVSQWLILPAELHQKLPHNSTSDRVLILASVITNGVNASRNIEEHRRTIVATD